MVLSHRNRSLAGPVFAQWILRRTKGPSVAGLYEHGLRKSIPAGFGEERRWSDPRGHGGLTIR